MKSLRVVLAQRVKVTVAVTAPPTVCKPVLVVVVQAVPVVASPLQAPAQTDSQAVVVLVKHQVLRAPQPCTLVVAVAQHQPQALVAVADWVALAAVALAVVTASFPRPVQPIRAAAAAAVKTKTAQAVDRVWWWFATLAAVQGRAALFQQARALRQATPCIPLPPGLAACLLAG
jgi:hypothetical protein